MMSERTIIPVERTTSRYYMNIRYEDEAVKALLDRITAAQEEIYDCYNDLEKIGTAILKSAPISVVNEVTDNR